MSTRDVRLAVQEHVADLQLVVSCISHAIVDVRGGYFSSARPHRLIVGDGSPIRLVAQPGVSCDIRQLYVIDRDETTQSGIVWRVRVVSYMYSVLDDQRREVFGFHWHPDGPSRITRPHLHLGHASGVTYPHLLGAHLPTGQVELRELVRCLIEEFGVEPRRPDWRAVLAAAGA